MSAAMRRIARLFGVFTMLAVGGLAIATPAAAHEERPTRTLDGTGSVPVYRQDGPTILVCKTDKADFDKRISGFPAELKAENERLWQQCQTDGHRHLQEAVDAAKLPGTNIKILPGVYLEEPSLAPPSAACAATYANAPKGKVYEEF